MKPSHSVNPVNHRIQWYFCVGAIILIMSPCLAQIPGLEVYGAGTDTYVLVEKIGGALVTDLDYSPDGKFVAASGQGLGVYSSLTGERIVYLSKPWIEQVAWSPEGGLIAVTHSEDNHDGSAGLVELLESRLLTLRVILALEEPSLSTSISWSPRGDLLATTGYSRSLGNRSISIWNISTGRIQHRLEWDAERAVKILKWSPDGSAIVSLLESVNGTETLWIWNLTTFSIQAERDFETPMSDLEWSPDGSLLAMSFSQGHNTTILDPWTMLPITLIRSDEQDEYIFAEGTPMPLSPYNIAWSRNGSLLAGAFADGVVKIWDATSGSLVSRSRVPGGRGLCFSPAEDKLAVGSGTGIDIWDYGTDQHVQSPTSGPFRTAVWSQTGDTVFCSTEEDGVVAVTGLWKGSEPPRLETIIQPESRDLKAISLSKDARYLATFWQYPGSVQMWDLSQDPPNLSASYSSRAFYAAFSPGGDRLAWSSLGLLMIMDIASNTTISMDPQSRILDLDWPGGETILSGNELDDGSGEIIVWDARNGAILRRIPNERGAVWAITSSPTFSESPEDKMVAVLCGPYSLWYYYGGLRVYNSSWDIIYDGALKGASTFSWPSLSWSPEGQTLAWAHYAGRYTPITTPLYTILLYSTRTWNLTQTLDGEGTSWLDEMRLLTIQRDRTGHGTLLIWASIPESSPFLSGAVMILAIWITREGLVKVRVAHRS